MPRVSESRLLELDSSEQVLFHGKCSQRRAGRTGAGGRLPHGSYPPQPPWSPWSSTPTHAEIRSGPRRGSRYRVLDAHRPADPGEAQHCTREPPHHRPDALKPPLLLLLRGAATRPAPENLHTISAHMPPLHALLLLLLLHLPTVLLLPLLLSTRGTVLTVTHQHPPPPPPPLLPPRLASPPSSRPRRTSCRCRRSAP